MTLKCRLLQGTTSCEPNTDQLRSLKDPKASPADESQAALQDPRPASQDVISEVPTCKTIPPLEGFGCTAFRAPTPRPRERFDVCTWRRCGFTF
jgi:hypothetical protein